MELTAFSKSEYTKLNINPSVSKLYQEDRELLFGSNSDFLITLKDTEEQWLSSLGFTLVKLEDNIRVATTTIDKFLVSISNSKYNYNNLPKVDTEEQDLDDLLTGVIEDILDDLEVPYWASNTFKYDVESLVQELLARVFVEDLEKDDVVVIYSCR